MWSLTTCLSATAQSKKWLALLRIGVGIGEAGCAPAALSLIACMYKPSRKSWRNGGTGVGIGRWDCVGERFRRCVGG